MLPTKEQARELLFQHVADSYQRLHAQMVAVCMEGYARHFNEDPVLWYMTGYLHDIDFEHYPDQHPGPSLEWFCEWGYPEELIHAVLAHAYGYNGYDVEPETKLASALIACDEICGIFYAYRKVNPIPYGQMSAKSIKKRLKAKDFAPKIQREDIEYGCEKLGVSIDAHVEHLITFFSVLD